VGPHPASLAGPQDGRRRDRLVAVLHRRDRRPRPPGGRRRVEKKGPAGEPDDHALGRSQGGFGTKLSLICDGGGTPLAVAVGPGQQHETQQAIALLEEALAWPDQPAKVAGDKAYSAGWLRAWLSERRIKPVIAHQKKEPGRARRFDKKTYRRRNVIERCVNSLKWFRRVATRYEKLATHYLGMVTVAIIFRLLG
jgi:transposase